MPIQKKEKLIVLVAVNGSQMDPKILPYLPISPNEVAEQAFKCYQAGASVVHIHARDEKTRSPSNDINLFNEMIKQIRAKCEILIQTTGSLGRMRDPVTKKEFFPSDEERLSLLTIEPKQDMMPTPLATRDYIYQGGHTVFYNTPDYLRKVIPGIINRKIGLEFEISNMSVLYNALRQSEEGVFDKDMPLLLNYMMGSKGNQPSIPKQLIHISEEGKRLFPQAKWEVTTSDENHWQMLTLAISLGCNVVRVGLEDHFYFPNGEMATHNVQLVEHAIKIAHYLGRDIATPKEAREILSLEID